MSISGLAPPPPFLPVPGRPAVAWPQWFRIFENYVLASGASDCTPDRPKALLLHSLGVEGQRIFYTLPLLSLDNVKLGEQTATEKTPVDSKGTGDTRPEVSSYDIAVAALHAHFSATSNVVAERHRFSRRVQQAGESVNEYITAFRELSATCSFPAEEDSLRDQFVAGISSRSLRERLLLEGSSLSFVRAVLLAKQFEQAYNDLQEFPSDPSRVQLWPFRPHSPIAWFPKVDAQLYVNGVAYQLWRFVLVKCQLHANVFDQLKLPPPDDHLFDGLNEAFIRFNGAPLHYPAASTAPHSLTKDAKMSDTSVSAIVARMFNASPPHTTSHPLQMQTPESGMLCKVSEKASELALISNGIGDV
ncbi:uncharacterized protein LOC144095538 [Amblyomma americanum]